VIRRVILLMLLSVLLTVPTAAEGLEEALGVSELTDAVPTGAREALGELSPTSPEAEGTIEILMVYGLEQLRGILTEILRPVSAIAAVCILGNIGENLSTENGDKNSIAAMGSCLAIAVIGAEDVHSVIGMGRSTLTELLDFSGVLLPTLTSAAAMTGAVSSAGAAYAAAALFFDVLLSLAGSLIFPLICAFLGLSAAAGVLGDNSLDGGAAFLRWAAKSGMKFLALAFTGYLSITGILTSAADSAAVKTAKTLLASALPVVGKLMADASEALVAGAGLLKGAIGVYGMLVCIAVVLVPVLRLGLRLVIFRGAAAIISGLCGSRQQKLIACLADAYGMVLGLIGTGAALVFLSVIALIRTVAV